MTVSLPRGIYYEPSRERYRVRIYKHNTVIHCSYHKALDDAILALDKAQAERVKFELPDENAGDGSTISLLARLCNGK